MNPNCSSIVSTGVIDSGTIILITTTVMTGLISLVDLLVNIKVLKKRHFTSSCCTGSKFKLCGCVYDSESELQETPKGEV